MDKLLEHFVWETRAARRADLDSLARHCQMRTEQRIRNGLSEDRVIVHRRYERPNFRDFCDATSFRETRPAGLRKNLILFWYRKLRHDSHHTFGD